MTKPQTRTSLIPSPVASLASSFTGQPEPPPSGSRLLSRVLLTGAAGTICGATHTLHLGVHQLPPPARDQKGTGTHVSHSPVGPKLRLPGFLPGPSPKQYSRWITGLKRTGRPPGPKPWKPTRPPPPAPLKVWNPPSLLHITRQDRSIFLPFPGHLQVDVSQAFSYPN